MTIVRDKCRMIKEDKIGKICLVRLKGKRYIDKRKKEGDKTLFF